MTRQFAATIEAVLPACLARRSGQPRTFGLRSNCWATCVTGRAMRVYVHRVRVSPLAEAVGLRGHAAALLVAWPYCGPISDGSQRSPDSRVRAAVRPSRGGLPRMGASTGGMKRTSKCPQSDAPVHGDNRGCPTCVSSKTIRTATAVWVAFQLLGDLRDRPRHARLRASSPCQSL